MASSNEESPAAAAAAKDKRSPPPFHIEGILRGTKEKKEGEQPTGASNPASLLPAPISSRSTAPSRLQMSPLSSPVNSFISRPFPGRILIHVSKAVNDVSVLCQ